MKIQELYSQWLKETKHSGGVLIVGSIQEFFRWLDENNYSIIKNKDFEINIFSDGYRRTT